MNVNPPQIYKQIPKSDWKFSAFISLKTKKRMKIVFNEVKFNNEKSSPMISK